MAVVLRAVNGEPMDTFGSSSNTNPFSTRSPTTPGLFSGHMFGDLSAGNGSGTTGAAHAITPTSAGSSSGFGFVDPSAQERGTNGRAMSAGTAAGGASVPQLLPSEPIGMPQAKVPEVQPKPNKPSTTLSTEGGEQSTPSTPSATDHFNTGKVEALPGGTTPLALGTGSRYTNGGSITRIGGSNGGSSTSDAEATDINNRAGI